MTKEILPVVKSMRPGEKGTQRLLREWGEHLVMVRYREDEAKTRRYTTIEIVVDERKRPEPQINQRAALAQRNKQLVGLRVHYADSATQKRLRQAKAYWHRGVKLWLCRYDTAVALGLRDRIVEGALDGRADVPLYLE